MISFMTAIRILRGHNDAADIAAYYSFSHFDERAPPSFHFSPASHFIEHAAFVEVCTPLCIAQASQHYSFRCRFTMT